MCRLLSFFVAVLFAYGSFGKFHQGSYFLSHFAPGKYAYGKSEEVGLLRTPQHHQQMTFNDILLIFN